MRKDFKILGIFLIIYLFAFSVTPAFGQAEEATPPAVLQIREKVKEIVREKIDEIKRGPVRAFAGEISQITPTLLTITTARGEKKVQINEETKIVGKNKKDIKIEDLKTGNFLIVMGFLNEDKSLQARRLVVSEKPKLPLREVAFGKVSDISAEVTSLTVKNEKKSMTYTVVATDKTVITKKVGKKIEKVNFSAIEKGDRIVTIGTPTENEKKFITAKIIHVIPGLATGQVTPTASPTPKATPTPKASGAEE